MILTPFSFPPISTEKSSSYKIIIIGAGGLGVAAAWGLATSAGPNFNLDLKIFDPDQIEISNLNRQVMFTHQDVSNRSAKADTLAARLAQLLDRKKQYLNLEAFKIRIDQSNIAELLAEASFVIDACDSISTKFLLNDFCIGNNIPFCYAGVAASYGQLLLVPAKTNSLRACLRCLFGEISQEDLKKQQLSCRQGGVFGPVVGLLGFLQANSALNYLTLRAEKRESILTRFCLDKLSLSTSVVPLSESCTLGCGNLKLQRTFLNLREKHCPDTFLFTKLALEKLPPSSQLEVEFFSEESSENVKKSVTEEGHLVLSKQIIKGEFTSYRLVIQK